MNQPSKKQIRAWQQSYEKLTHYVCREYTNRKGM